MRHKLRALLAFLVAVCSLLVVSGALARQVLASSPGGRRAAGLGQPGSELSNWSAPLPVYDAPVGTDAQNAAIAVDTDNRTVHITWEERGSTETSVRYAQRDEGHLFWSVDADFSLPGDSPAIAVDADHQPHIVYASVFSHRLQIFHCARTLQGWAAPHVVVATTGHSTDPDIAIIIHDDIHIAWAEDLAGIKRIYHARSADQGVTWDAAQPIPYALGYAPTLSLAYDGAIWVAWQSDTALSSVARADIYASRWDGEDWSLPTNVSANSSADSRSPDIAWAGGAHTHLVWEKESLDGTLYIQYARWEKTSAAWSTPVTLSQSGWAMQPSLAVGEDGSPYVAWDSGHQLILCSLADELDPRVEQIASSEEGIRDVSVAIDRQNRIHAVWSARDGGLQWRLYTNDRAPEATPTASATALETIPVPTATFSPSPSPTSTLTPNETLPPRPTATPTCTATASATATPSHTGTATPTAIATHSQPSITPTPTLDASPSRIASATPTADSATPTAEGTIEPVISSTPTPTVSTYILCLPLLTRRQGDSEGIRAPLPRNVSAAQRLVRASPEPTMPAGWRWSDVHNVSRSATDSCCGAVAAGPDGTAHAVWQEQVLAGFWQLCSSHCLTETWSQPECFFMGQDPVLRIADDGVPHLVYCAEVFGNHEIYHTTWAVEGWEAPTNVSQTKGRSTQPALLLCGGERMLVTWTEDLEGVERIHYAWRAEGNWNTYRVPASLGGSTSDVAADRGDRVWVAWQAPEATNDYDVYVIDGVYQQDVQWGPYAMNISESPFGDSTFARLAGRPSLGTFAVWQEETAQGKAISYANNLQDAYYWSPPSLVSEASSYVALPDISVGPIGPIVISWQAEGQLLHSYRFTGQDWSAPAPIVQGDASEVALDIGPGLTLGALWSERHSDASQEIHHRRGWLNWPHHLWLPLTASPRVSRANRSR